MDKGDPEDNNLQSVSSQSDASLRMTVVSSGRCRIALGFGSIAHPGGKRPMTFSGLVQCAALRRMPWAFSFVRPAV